MKVIVLGAGGNIGREIIRILEPTHQFIKVGRSRGDILVDNTDADSVRDMFKSAGEFDAVIAAVGGDSVFRACEELSDEDYEHGFRQKFLAQVDLVRIGTDYARDGGSFALSSGFLAKIKQVLHNRTIWISGIRSTAQLRQTKKAIWVRDRITATSFTPPMA